MITPQINMKIERRNKEKQQNIRHPPCLASYYFNQCNPTRNLNLQPLNIFKLFFRKMGNKLYFHVFFFIYFASTADSVSQAKKIVSNGNTKSVNSNESQPHLASNQAIVCYDYTGQVFLISPLLSFGKNEITLFLGWWPISYNRRGGRIVEARLWQQDWVLLLWRLLDSLWWRQFQ